MPNPQQLADIIDLELLRSVEWTEAVECTDGAVIWFDLEEMGLHGWAEVVRVEPCPPIKAGPGRVVLATVTHYNSFLTDLRLAGVVEPLHLTDRHRLFSATRHDWIPASDLRASEDLATRSGTARIESVSTALLREFERSSGKKKKARPKPDRKSVV